MRPSDLRNLATIATLIITTLATFTTLTTILAVKVANTPIVARLHCCRNMPPPGGTEKGGAPMPRRPARPCSVPGCPNLVKGSGRRLCPEHQAEAWRKESQTRRAQGRDSQYGREWAQVSARFLRAHPICAHCGGASEIAHHVLAREAGGADDPANLIALCRSCHSRLHARRGDSLPPGGKGR